MHHEKLYFTLTFSHSTRKNLHKISWSEKLSQFAREQSNSLPMSKATSKDDFHSRLFLQRCYPYFEPAPALQGNGLSRIVDWPLPTSFWTSAWLPSWMDLEASEPHAESTPRKKLGSQTANAHKLTMSFMRIKPELSFHKSAAKIVS